MAKGFALWFTGLSGAGKSTLSQPVADRLAGARPSCRGPRRRLVRTNLSKGLGFTKEDRDINVRRIGFVANLLARNGVAAVTAAISPYRAVRDEVRAMMTADGAGFVEVYVHCPIEVLAARDVKGLYKKGARGRDRKLHRRLRSVRAAASARGHRRLVEGDRRRQHREGPRQAARARLRPRRQRGAGRMSPAAAAQPGSALDLEAARRALDGKSPRGGARMGVRHVSAHRHLHRVRPRRLRAGGHGGRGEARDQGIHRRYRFPVRGVDRAARQVRAQVRRADRGPARRSIDRRAEPAARPEPVAARHRSVLRAAQGRADGAGARAGSTRGSRACVAISRRRAPTSTSSSTTSGRKVRCTRSIRFSHWTRKDTWDYLTKHDSPV